MRNKIRRQHKRIYQAVMARKPEAAKRMATAHVRFVSESMSEIERQGTKIIRVSLDQSMQESVSPACNRASRV